uniref:(northern house mosquito) hypothetical protein n=1 Tax=Culex pipiens TaxID=7175 RepID=A0A8D8AG44_CULPI
MVAVRVVKRTVLMAPSVSSRTGSWRMRTARSTSGCTAAVMDATIAIVTTNGMSTVSGDGAAWDVTVVECRVVPECSPKDVDRTQMTGGVVVIGSVTTNGTDTTATIGMHPQEVTIGITETVTGETVPTRTSEDIHPVEVPAITECNPEEAEAPPEVTTRLVTAVPTGTELPAGVAPAERTLWTIETEEDADRAEEEAAATTKVEGNRLRRRPTRRDDYIESEI